MRGEEGGHGSIDGKEGGLETWGEGLLFTYGLFCWYGV